MIGIKGGFTENFSPKRAVSGATKKQKRIRSDEFAWNPTRAWQLLRRNGKYRAEIDAFKATADTHTLDLFRMISQRVLEFDAVPDSSYLALREQDPKRTLERGIGGGESFDEHFDVFIDDLFRHSDKAVQLFVEKYGYVLRYPIDYEVDEPNPFIMHELWALIPARPSRDNSPRNPFTINIQINCLFSANSIAEAVRELAMDIATSKFSQIQPKWEDLDIFAKAYDLDQNGVAMMDIARVLKQTYAARIPTTEDPSRSVRDRIRQFKEWLRYFDPITCETSPDLP